MSLEDEFHDEMLELYWKAGRAMGYWAHYYLRGVRNHGGLAYAKHLLSQEGTSSGLKRVIDAGRSDLSVEALVLDQRFSCLFTPDQANQARARLGGAAV